MELVANVEGHHVEAHRGVVGNTLQSWVEWGLHPVHRQLLILVSIWRTLVKSLGSFANHPALPFDLPIEP